MPHQTSRRAEIVKLLALREREGLTYQELRPMRTRPRGIVARYLARGEFQGTWPGTDQLILPDVRYRDRDSVYIHVMPELKDLLNKGCDPNSARSRRHPVDWWWVRVCDFPRLQVLALTLAGGLVFVPFLGHRSARVSLVLAIGVVANQMYWSFPYLAIAVKGDPST